MKLTLKLKYFTLFLCAGVMLNSCAKEEAQPETQDPGPVNTVPPIFRWITVPGNLVESDSSVAFTQSGVVFGYKNGNSHTVETRLSSMNTGTYQISSATGNELDYFVNNKLHTGTGTFIISESTSSKISGTFSCSLAGGTLTSISGTFESVPKRYN